MPDLLILYTANLRGDLDLLPRLYTFMRRLRQDLPPASLYRVFDLGQSCAPEVWHCAATGGRSALIVLDAMGCHAAQVALPDDARDRLRANLLGMALVDDAHPWRDGECVVTAAAPPPESYNLHIRLSPAGSTRLEGRSLYLAAAQAGQVGQAALSGDPPALLSHGLYDLPPSTLPDPTITAAVDFVLAEARRLPR